MSKCWLPAVSGSLCAARAAVRRRADKRIFPMSEPFFKTDCPSCGAPVHAHSATAVTLVCGYCNSLLLRQDDGVVDTGRDSALLEDFSPLQIGTTGTFGTQNFTLVGRLQARYDVGVWNEWYALFDDGSSGWLAEAGDQYVFTVPAAEHPAAEPPPFDALAAGESRLVYRDKAFVASDVRHITLSQAAAEGELPFALPPQMTNRVADWRCEHLFLTTDYAAEPPEIFVGRGVTLEELKLGHTRSSETIADSAGRLKGTRRAESCPNCGSEVQWIAGLTPTVICPSCHSDLSTDGGKAELVRQNGMRQEQQRRLTLPLGAQGRINGKTYTVIGAVCKDELDPDDAWRMLHGGYVEELYPEGQWTEYLLFEPQSGFLWLVETRQGEWSVSETLNRWPTLQGQSLVPRNGRKLYDYGGRVRYAVGAFYWHIRADDVNYYTDYDQGQSKLCIERSPSEVAWSKSTPVSYAHIREWFGLKADAPAYQAKMTPDRQAFSWPKLLKYVFVLINLPAILTALDRDGFTGFALVAGITAAVAWFIIRAGRFAGLMNEPNQDDEA